VPDIGKLLWPRSVAVVGASSDTERLRGRILQVMKGHPFQGPIYPVCRGETEVQGLPAFRSVAELPAPPDLAVLIIPAKFVPDELERCGAAGIPAATILSSGFAEEPGETGRRLQDEVRAIAERYDMAVSGPNGEGFANTAAALCPTFSPVMEADSAPTPALAGRTTGQVAVISQSGGMGFAFLDRGRPKNLSFRYIVTTGNEACLETFDFVDYMLDEGKTDVFLLLLEDVKNFATFERVAAKALRAGKPLIVSKLGRSPAGSRAVLSHTASRAGRYDDYRTMFARYAVIESSDLDEMIDVAAGFLMLGARLPPGLRVGVCTSSGGGGAWVADACAEAGLEVPELDAATRAAIDARLPPYGTSQNPVDVTAQAVHQFGYAAFARLVAASPVVDAVIVVVTGRYPRLLLRDREPLLALARESAKPIVMWSYTAPADACIALLREAGYPLFTDLRNCVRALRAMAEYRASRERLMKEGT
jgi:acyl-CoA synthetase (NDP forming)